jgi:hypothetical protein
MDTASSFSATYAEAREKFREAVKGAGGELESITHPERGPDHGSLTTDVAWLGPRDADAVLVMISGTHGVEGFCGSGAQVNWLQRSENSRLPAGIGVLMLHAVNPYGFAWLRRVTHENVDLNRNWIDFGKPTPHNPGYAEIAEVLCPKEWTDDSRHESNAFIRRYIELNGMAAWQQAVSGGQYSHPWGLFYGGSGPTWSRQTQTSILQAYLQSAARVAIIDYHTGLGPWGYGEQIVTDAMGSPGFARASAWFGRAVTSPNSGTSASAPIQGDGLSVAAALTPQAEVTGLALEFGTQSLSDVLTALRADAWLHAHGEVDSDIGRAIKDQIRKAFYGDADDWKGMVAGQSLLAIKQAVIGLAAAGKDTATAQTRSAS